MGFAQLDADRKTFEAQKRAFDYRRKFQEEVSDFEAFSSQSEFGEEFFFFRGVTHQLALKKRYKDLIKIYHPDNINGDKAALQKINEEYDRLNHILAKQKIE